MKRTAEKSGSGSPNKKTHPFFSRSTFPSHSNYVASPHSLIHFLHLDPFCPKPASPVSIVFYDLDGTLIKTKSGAGWPKGRDDFMWWHPSVPGKLKEEWSQGKHIVVLSNQGGHNARTEWRAKLPLLAAKMPADVPIRILGALSMEDKYRKPGTGMFDTIVDVYRAQGLEIDISNSVFIGDAAGRQACGSRKKDHSDTDYKMALNVGLRFCTPEEHFLAQPQPAYPMPPKGFRPSRLGNLADLPQVVPSSTPITRQAVELVVFVGPPASGKTSFYRRYFKQYAHVNQDLLGTRDRCLKTAEDLLTAGKSVVVDNTNRNRATRAYWIALAEKLEVPIRLFHFLCPIDLAKHNNVYRALHGPPDEPPRTLLPQLAFSTFIAAFEKPNKDEGFDEIRGVNFVWQGDEMQRKLWDRYMLEPKR